MSMNFLDAAGVLADSAELLADDMMAREAKSIVQATVDAYDALAPDWSQAPEDAQWYTIDADGTANLHVAEPIPVALWYVSCWESGAPTQAGVVLIPLGVDWRLLKWQRPEVAA